MRKADAAAARLDELVLLGELHEHPRLKQLLPSKSSAEWAVRTHRAEYIAGGAVYEIFGRLLAHPGHFERVTLEIGSRTLAQRHGVQCIEPAA